MGGEQTHQSTKVIPDFRYVRIQTDCAGVCIEGVAVLIDLVVEHAYRTPECRIPPVTVDRLLIRLVRFWILLLRHVASAK